MCGAHWESGRGREESGDHAHLECLACLASAYHQNTETFTFSTLDTLGSSYHQQLLQVPDTRSEAILETLPGLVWLCGFAFLAFMTPPGQTWDLPISFGRAATTINF